jgi:hypothetical protein
VTISIKHFVERAEINKIERKNDNLALSDDMKFHQARVVLVHDLWSVADVLPHCGEYWYSVAARWQCITSKCLSFCYRRRMPKDEAAEVRAQIMFFWR